MWIASCITALIRGGGRGGADGSVADAVENVLLWRGLRLPSECECWGAVVGGRTQSSGGKDVPDPTSQRGCAHGAPRIAKDPGASTAVEAMARFCGETILPRPPPMVLAASRIFGSRPAPGRRWPAGWRTGHPWPPGPHLVTALVNGLALDLLNAPPTGPDGVIGRLRSGPGLVLRGL